jgi:ribosomal protein L31E
MEIEIDHDLNRRIYTKGCSPVVFVPEVNLLKLEEESIINSF